MTPPKIVIVSHGRCNRVHTLKGVEGMLCVAKSQEPLYREFYPDAEYVIHPDEVLGLPAKRNWVVEHFKKDDVFMIDDDITSIVDLTTPPRSGPTAVKRAKVPLLIERCRDMAEDLGTYLFSFASNANHQQFMPQRPFKFTGYVLGGAFGLRAGHGLWWHPDCIQEDYWISALNAHYHRKIVRDDRYGFHPKDTFKSDGGLSATRTMKHMQEAIVVLQEHFGKDVIVMKKDANWGKRNHPFQPQLQLPF
jgi:hypothetical protein